MRWFARLVLVAVTLLAGQVGAQGRRFELSDLGREVAVSAPRLSPDSRTVAVVLSRTNYAENRFERTLSVVEVATGAVRDLTPGRRNIGQVEWSPSGDRLAFIDREGEKPPQLYVLPLAGGEARRLTDVPHGVNGFAWRPDGKALAFLTPDAPVERTGEERHNKSFEVGDNMYLDQAVSRPSHLWVIPADSGAATRITSGERTVMGVSWSPDGTRLLLNVRPRPHSGEMINATVVVREVTGGTERTVSERRGFSGAMSFSPDGARIATIASRGPEVGFRPGTVLIHGAEGTGPLDATRNLDRNVNDVHWLPGSDALLVTANDLTRQRAWVQPLNGGARRLEWGAVDASAVHVNRGGSLVFVGREPNRPGEVWFASSVDAAPRRLTDFNRELAALETGKIETITWAGPDGFEQNGVITYPPGYEPGRRYPLVLQIHGGPMGTSVEGWSAPNQLLAAQGWIVFSPNYRGSDNMGDRFQRAVINDAGEGPGRDVMSGVEALKTRGLVDPTRMAVSGWSYGGYMTAWLTSHYQVWKAAVAGAAVTDWFDWYNMADMNTWAGFGLGGSPWRNDNATNYWRQSPMAYAHRIRTPTLILSTTGDPRVTVTQSYKYYHALKDNGVPVQFIAYPTGGHFPPDPVHQRDVRRRWMEWIAREFERPASP